MGMIQNLEKGKVLTALKDVVTSIEAEFQSLETEFPLLAQFVNQFDSDFGKAALTDGEQFISAIQAGTSTVSAAGSALVSQLESQALDTAGHDALTVATNAIGVLLRAPAAAAAPTTVPAVDAATPPAS